MNIKDSSVLDRIRQCGVLILTKVLCFEVFESYGTRILSYFKLRPRRAEAFATDILYYFLGTNLDGLKRLRLLRRPLKDELVYWEGKWKTWVAWAFTTSHRDGHLPQNLETVIDAVSR